MKATRQTSRHHHFVPVFLLRPWQVNSQLHGYWWNDYKNEVDCKRKGPKAFCNQIGLLTLQACSRGSDALETIFFGEIDTRGAITYRKILAEGPGQLSGEERCDFARLLMSLEASRPATVNRLRSEGSHEIASTVNRDPALLNEMAKYGIDETPSSYHANCYGTSMHDVALLSIQKLSSDPEVGSVLINSEWGLIRLESNDHTSFVTSDRPFVRIHSYDSPGAVFALPLNPRCAFVAANHPNNLDRFRRISPKRFAKHLNANVASQSDRFIFASDEKHSKLLRKYLKPSKH